MSAVTERYAPPAARELPAAAPASPRPRGVARTLVTADALGLAAAYALAESLVGGWGSGRLAGHLVFLVALPLWLAVASLGDTYDGDERRASHTSVDDLTGIFRLVAGGVWLLLLAGWALGAGQLGPVALLLFSALAVPLVTCTRAAARAACRRAGAYRQRTLVYGAGHVGQLVARKVRQHPEYHLTVVGFVDSEPRPQRPDLAGVPVLGGGGDLVSLIERHAVDRVVFAFSGEPAAHELEAVQAARRAGVIVDIVPRLFEAFGSRVELHQIEGLPLVGIPASRTDRLPRLLKRAVDVVGASLGLLLAAPVFALAAWQIRRTSPGPVFFRQTRLGLGMEPFTVLKFRTMRVDADQDVHREYVAATMSAQAAPQSNGLYKLERADAVTPAGRWLRRTSLDELPQLLNVLRGDMSLVGPRPCIPYEVEHYRPYHFERFLVPAGLTGLWQVAARARSTYAEALELDVAYARSWSLGLDLLLLLKTPVQLLRGRVTA